MTEMKMKKQEPTKQLDPNELEFKNNFAHCLVVEARELLNDSQARQAHLREAMVEINAAIEGSARNAEFHITRGLVSAEMGNYADAVQSYRNAVTFDPSRTVELMTLINIGSQAVNEEYSGSVHDSSLKIQELISEKKFDEAVNTALADINAAMSKSEIPNLWNVQLMRLAANLCNRDSDYAQTLIRLEHYGSISKGLIDYQPLSSTLSFDQRKEIIGEMNSPKGGYAKIVLSDHSEHITPINGMAARGVSAGRFIRKPAKSQA
jgi:hypothetical protein